MELIVKAKHYKDTSFISICSCALAKAAIEQFGASKVFEFIDHIQIDKLVYVHEEYEDQFERDALKAASLNYSDEVIRTIELTPITKPCKQRIL